MNTIQAFIDAMQNAGIVTRDPIIDDGQLHRIHIEGHKRGSKNGAYILHTDQHAAGWFMDYTTGLSETWTAKGRDNQPPSAEFLAQIEAAKTARQKQRLENEAKAAEKARYIWQKAAFADSSHSYLTRKQIQPHGAKLSTSGALIIPLYNDLNEVVNLQFIHQDGSKRFLKDGRKKGCFWWLGKRSETVLICEGFATGASLHESTGHLTVIAFDAGNLAAVAKLIRERQPAARLVICADNDPSGVGQDKANAAALAVGGFVAMPPATGDFNDYATMIKENRQ